jgi:ELWxxDGT repeat protein
MSLRTRKSLPALAAALVLSSLSARADADGVAVRVKDINTEITTQTGWICGPRPEGAEEAKNFLELGSTLLISAAGATAGCELHATEGDPATTRLVRELVLGFSGADPLLLGTVGGVGYFVARTPELGDQLWRTDGSRAGTWRLTEVEDQDVWGVEIGPLRALGPLALVFVTDRAHGTELWRSDGSRAGTRLVADIRLGAGSAVPEPWNQSAAVLGPHLYFAADDGASGVELWRSDGTPAGTSIVTDFGQLEWYLGPRELVRLGDRIYFARATELWSSDGTGPGTRRVADLSAWIDDLVVVGDRLYVDAEGALWAFDPAGAPGLLLASFEEVWSVAGFRGGVLFYAYDSLHGGEPWVSDGTAEGTLPLGDLWPGSGTSCGDPCEFFVVGEKAYFQATDGELWYALAVTDGSTAGTYLLLDFFQGVEESVRPLGVSGGGLLVAGTTAETATELYRTDGTPAGTARLTDLGREIAGTNLEKLADSSGTVLFWAKLQFQGWHPLDGIWRSDGTEAGTFELAGSLGGYGCGYEDLTALPSGRAVARSSCDDTGDLLWSTDGTAVQPIQVFVYPCSHHWCGIRSGLHRAGEVALFDWSLKEDDWELWSTDGSLGGTGLFLDLRPGPESSSALYFADFFGELLFTANDGIHGEEPWVSGGTPATTRLLAELVPGAEGLFPEDLFPFDAETQSFFYTVDVETPGSSRSHLELWFVPLATPLALRPGAVEAIRVGPDFERWSFRGLGVVAGRFLFATVRDPVLVPVASDVELWSSDGTPEGTGRVLDLRPGPLGSEISWPAALADRLLFAACEPRAGCELWGSDGTPEGTSRVLDIAPGWLSSMPTGLVAIDGRVYFSACEEATGCEPWVSDGTAAGTYRLDDIAPGPESSLGATPPRFDDWRWETPSFVRAGPWIYFAADDGTGTELWALPAEAVLGDGFESGEAEPRLRGARPEAR